MMQRLAAWWRQADRRAYRRQRGDAVRISVSGRRHTVLDWSLGGFRIEAHGLQTRRGERIDGAIDYRGCHGEFGAEVMESSDGEVSARFLEITPRVLLAMTGLAER